MKRLRLSPQAERSNESRFQNQFLTGFMVEGREHDGKHILISYSGSRLVWTLWVRVKLIILME